MEDEILTIFINPIETLVCSNLVLDLKVNYPDKKLVFYGIAGPGLDP